MRIGTKLAALFVSLFGAGAAIAAAPAPAMAASGYLTFWDGCAPSGASNPTSGKCGAAWAFNPSNRTLNQCYAVPSGSNDRFSAFDNGSGHNWRVWTNASCGAGGGSSAVLYNGTSTTQLGSGFDNTISSIVRIS